MQAHGHEAEARVASGAGPNRAQVIGGAADRGFAQHGYARVFADYQAAVEDALATTAVPEPLSSVKAYPTPVAPAIPKSMNISKPSLMINGLMDLSFWSR
jgi:hypothetical protein